MSGKLSIEERLARLERAMGLSASEQEENTFLRSPEAIHEYWSALLAFTRRRDRKPLDAFLEKTGGRVPELGGSRG